MLAYLRHAIPGLFLFFLPALALGQVQRTCPPATDIHVSAIEGSMQYIHKSTEDITRIYRQYSPGTTLVAAGLTVAQIQFRIKIDVSQADSNQCVSPRIYLMIDPGNQMVYISDELPVGSCAYEEIRIHELRHVAINREAATSIASQLQQRVRERISTMRLDAPQNELEMRIMDMLYNQEIPWARTHLKDYVDTAHAAHDSPQEYLRLNTVCNRALRRIRMVQSLDNPGMP